MSRLRFNHVFAALLAISVLSAFVISPRYTDPIRAQVQGIFLPVSLPARWIARAGLERFHAQPDLDQRPVLDIKEENLKLRAALASQKAQIERLEAIAADYERLGDIGRYCTRVAVIGNDNGPRDSLILQGSFASSLVNCPVLYDGGLAGRIERAGMGGAQVRLITDRDFNIRARFGRFEDDGKGGRQFFPVETRDPLLEGAGKGRMLIHNLQTKEAEAVHVGDWVVLDDPDWPPALRYWKLGQVVSKRPRTNAPLFAEIEVHPQWNLLTLRDVMVMNKTEGTEDRGQGSQGMATAREADRS